MFAWHKTIGALILVLALVRLAYRLKNPPPPFPPELPRWERIAAVWNHRAFYFLLIVLPLTGPDRRVGNVDDGHDAAGRRDHASRSSPASVETPAKLRATFT